MKFELKRISATTLQVALIVVVVLLFRILFVNSYVLVQQSHNLIFSDFVAEIYKDWIALLLVIAGNLGFMVFINRLIDYGKYPLRRLGILIGYVFLFSVLVWVVVNRKTIFHRGGLSELINDGRLIASYMACLLMNVIVVVVLYILFYIRHSNKAFTAERSKKRKAQYQYTQLKQQLNPHFLFNSLNILDYLVNNGETKRASDFIKKLAGIYRYMLNKENFVEVSLDDELRFVAMYVELLKERFTDGLNVEIDVADNLRSRHTVPCALQMMVENATKHNIVSSDSPLNITISIRDDKWIAVSNNLQPRINPYVSTGVGLKNISKQYADIVGHEIKVVKTESRFTVLLPLI